MASSANLKLGSKSEFFQRQGQTWNCTTGLQSDILVEVGDMSFNLHKFPLLSRSGKLEKMIAEALGTNGETSSTDGGSCALQLPDLPGGAKAFELVAKFCYGIKLEFNTRNIAFLRCAAEYLQMTEEYGEGNLIQLTESFLGDLFNNWKDSLNILKSCEDVLPLSEELHIVSRCINSLSSKAHVNPSLFSWPMGQNNEVVPNAENGSMWNGISGESRPVSFEGSWWYEDVCLLSLPMYKMFISAVKSRGMDPESIAGSLMMYAKQHLAGLSRNPSTTDGSLQMSVDTSTTSASEGDRRALLEEIINMLPTKKKVTSAKHLLGLLRFAVILKASASCKDNLEKRVGAQLNEAALEDLLMPNLDHSSETLYNVDCIQRILDHYLLLDQDEIMSIADDGQIINSSSPMHSPLATVAKLIDGYLAEIAPDANLSFAKFQSLAAAIPDSARNLDDGLYRAIDMYLKAHPGISESEREQLCHLMNCQKLSMDACTHAAQNERLPLRVVVQVIYFEQMRLRTSIAGWFFVSDSMDNNPPPPRHQKRDKVGHEAEGKGSTVAGGTADMKTRVLELEKECEDMKLEITNLKKSSGRWANFIRRFGLRSITPSFCDGNDTPVDCQRSRSRTSVL